MGSDDDEYIKYKIKHGDTLTKIAKEFGVTIDDLVDANEIEDPDLIIAGKTLYIPIYDDEEDEEDEEDDEYIEYTIKRGDTLTKIAKHFGVTVDDLVEANEIEDPDVIRAGDILYIPVDDESGC